MSDGELPDGLKKILRRQDPGVDEWLTVEYNGKVFEMRRLTERELESLWRGEPEIERKLIREVDEIEECQR